MEELFIRKFLQFPVMSFLENEGFIVHQKDDHILQIHRLGGEDIFIVVDEEMLYFQQQLGVFNDTENNELLLELLKLNGDITPVSVAIDVDEDGYKLLLVERRLRAELDGDELLAILDAMEVASERLINILEERVGGE